LARAIRRDLENDDGERVRHQSEDKAAVVILVPIGASILGIHGRRPVLGALWPRGPLPSPGHPRRVLAGPDPVCRVHGAVRDGPPRLAALVHRPEHQHFLLRQSLLTGSSRPLLHRHDLRRRGGLR